MSPEREPTKKLIAALHFQPGRQAGWKCGDCRRQGLERKRNCGWISTEPSRSQTPVWASKRLVLTECPTSYITAESITLLEAHRAWKVSGGGGLYDFPAPTVDAFLVIEEELLGNHD